MADMRVQLQVFSFSKRHLKLQHIFLSLVVIKSDILFFNWGSDSLSSIALKFILLTGLEIFH